MKFDDRIELSLDVELTTKEFKCDEFLSKIFSNPILFYLSNDHLALPVYTVLNFQNKVISYYNLFSEKNLQLVKEHNLDKCSVHSSFSIGNKGFYNFYFSNPELKINLFSFMDFEDLKHKFFLANDIFNGEYDFVNESTGNDISRPGYFFLGVKNKGLNKYEIYSCSYDLKTKIKLLDVNDRKYSPHDIKSFGNYLFATEFFEQRFKTKTSTFNDSLDLYKTFKKIGNIKPYLLYELNKQKQNIQVLNGKILIHKLEEGNTEYKFLETNFCPSHIEVIDNNMYISSHNFIMMEGNIYLNPASIDLYRYENDTPVFIKKFEDPAGFRFTAHKAFKRNNHPYVVTIGHPNRLFIVDGISMEKIKEIDLGGETVLNNEDNKLFINQRKFDDYDPLRFSDTEISDDGNYLLFWDQTFVNLLDLETYEITKIIDFTFKGFKQRTYHSTLL